jgi:DNA-binding beta-propeller fold protein YncE
MDVVKNNSQQPSTPAPLQTSGEDNAMHRQRGNRVLLVSSSILVFASIFTGVLFAYQKLQTKSTPSLEKLRTTNKPSQRKISTFQTIEIMSSNFNDSKTNMYFSDANKIYKKNFNGSNVEELATLPHNISSITMLPDGVLLMYTDNSTYEKVVNKQPGDTDYKQTIINYKYWALKPSSNELEQIDEQKYQMLIRLKDYSTSERIFTKELQNGQAEIVMDKHDGTQPTKIGVLTQKLVSLGCEFDPCPGKIHPSEFYPSFDGSYLLNKPLGGGGLGASGLVVSRDGRKVYKIDFYWYGSSAIWIDNDKLLTRAQDGTQKNCRI